MNASVITDSDTPLPDDTVSDDILVHDELADVTPADSEELAEAPLADVTSRTQVNDERANAPVSVVTERFFRALLLRIPLDRIEELHLFSPLRQGGVETGIAVVAARAPIQVVAPTPVDAPVEEEPIAIETTAVESTDDAITVSTEYEHENVESSADDSHARDDASPYLDEIADGAPSDLPTNKEEESQPAEEIEFGDAVSVEIAVPESVKSQNFLSESTPEASPTRTPRPRHVVYTARYHLVIKGPERGKWETDVVEEADAPLIAVETVVRGVQRRAGEDTETIRYTAAQIARALRFGDAP